MKFELKADRWRKCLICILHQNLPKKITLGFSCSGIHLPRSSMLLSKKDTKLIFINQSRSSQRCGITSNLGFYTCFLQQEFYSIFLVLY
ncbi:hypothetical protein CsSME_00008638 [Camellia sinensis var. sinensis]